MKKLTGQSRQQNTINKKVSIKGIGLHTGKKVNMKLLPAPVNTGIIFKRTDLNNTPSIEATIANVSSTERSTNLGQENISVFNVEHFMAALRAYNIDNIKIELNNKELPALDGSAKVYLNLLEKAGIKEQDKTRKIVKIKENYFIKSKNKYLGIFPSDKLKINYLIKFDYPVVQTEYFEFEYTPKSFREEIIPARSFGFQNEIEELKRRGLGLGGSLDNVILLKEDKVVNKLRFENEFVRHKILDLVGDLYLNGPIIGEIIAIRTGHSENYQISQLIQEGMN